VTDVTKDAIRREQALQLERIRLALRKTSRLSEVDATSELAWKRLGVPSHLSPQVREILHDAAATVLRETKGRSLPSATLDALTVVKDALSRGPDTALPAATRKLLLNNLGHDTAATICDLQDAGLAVVPADVLPAIQCLARDKVAPSDVTTLQSTWGNEWRLFADVALIGLDHAPLDPRQLLTMLWEPTDMVDPTQSGFHRWVAFRHAYDLTRHHEIEAAWEQISRFEEPPHTTTPLQKEIVNLRAYLILAKQGDKGLGEAMSLLKKIDRSPIARQNWEFLRKRKNSTLNERGRLENPYLALEVEHGSPTGEWRRAWMELRSMKNIDLDDLSAINVARDQIIKLERDASNGVGHIFVVPLSKEFTAPKVVQPSDRIAPELPAALTFRSDQKLSEALEILRYPTLKQLLTELDKLDYVKEELPPQGRQGKCQGEGRGNGNRRRQECNIHSSAACGSKELHR
jgi:hypothetical protein